MARPVNPDKNLRSFTCYLDERDLTRAEKLAKRELSSPSAVIRRAVRLGLDGIEKDGVALPPHAEKSRKTRRVSRV